MGPRRHVIEQRWQLLAALKPRMRAAASGIGTAALSLLLAACGTECASADPDPLPGSAGPLRTRGRVSHRGGRPARHQVLL
jgi:hypothetical protein